jgi:hypothetical protein
LNFGESIINDSFGSIAMNDNKSIPRKLIKGSIAKLLYEQEKLLKPKQTEKTEN